MQKAADRVDISVPCTTYLYFCFQAGNNLWIARAQEQELCAVVRTAFLQNIILLYGYIFSKGTSLSDEDPHHLLKRKFNEQYMWAEMPLTNLLVGIYHFMVLTLGPNLKMCTDMQIVMSSVPHSTGVNYF